MKLDLQALRNIGWARGRGILDDEANPFARWHREGEGEGEGEWIMKYYQLRPMVGRVVLSRCDDKPNFTAYLSNGDVVLGKRDTVEEAKAAVETVIRLDLSPPKEGE